MLAGVALLAACASTPLPPWPTQPAKAAAAPSPPQPQPPPGQPDTTTPPAENVVVTPVATQAPDEGAAAASTESAAVAARFPDPPVRYETPGLAPSRRAFTTNAELAQSLGAIATATRGSTHARLLDLGASQQGATIQAVVLSQAMGGRGATVEDNGRPTIVLIGGQHGDEPASGEALLVIARELAQGLLEPMLKRINAVIVPRANPDGADAGQHATANGIDLDQDHLRLKTPEARALAEMVRRYRPVAIIDVHEYPATPEPLRLSGRTARPDVMLRYATTTNVPEFVTKAALEWYLQPIAKALDGAGLTHEWHHTWQSGPDGLQATMGDTSPTSERNLGGLQNAVSLSIASRGADLGRLHAQRRVHSLVVALTSALRSTVDRAGNLQQVQSFVARDIAAHACRGTLAIQVEPTATRRDVRLLDADTGEERTAKVAWASTLQLQTTGERPRPCGYWLAVNRAEAVEHLRWLGVQVMRIAEPGSVLAEADGTTARTAIDAPADSFYVSMNQPLANVAAAALEQGTPYGFGSTGLLPGPSGAARVMASPALVFEEPD